MHLNELSAQSERYKQELMKLYGRRSPDCEPAQETAPAEEQAEPQEELPAEETADTPPEDEEIFGVDEDAPDDTTYSDHAEEENTDSPDSETEYNNRYPEPDLSVLGDNTFSTDSAYDTPPQYVSEESLGTVKFAVPAPDIVHSQAPDAIKRPYNLYDVSVIASGYFNARSVDVPVFDGITSVQNFSMIPVPLMMRGADETVTYFNQEPDFNGGSKS